jgi:hypothetical protein
MLHLLAFFSLPTNTIKMRVLLHSCRLLPAENVEQMRQLLGTKMPADQLVSFKDEDLEKLLCKGLTSAALLRYADMEDLKKHLGYPQHLLRLSCVPSVLNMPLSNQPSVSFPWPRQLPCS